VTFSGPNDALQMFGVTLIGVTPESGAKLLLTVSFLAAVAVLSWGLQGLVGAVCGRRWPQVRFWTRQAIALVAAVIMFISVISIWFDDPTRLATALGLITAGLAFALQRVITAIAGYFVILRGKTFDVGDRIVMGGVRGDVIALDFMQTTIMEMGQPPAVQNADPAMWVLSRQYTGRVVTVTNAKVFDEPIYNYSNDFPYLFEELSTPIRYTADSKRAEQILLEVASRHTSGMLPLGAREAQELRRRHCMRDLHLEPRVY
jgi:small-conductance mechanosensitive channel